MAKHTDINCIQGPYIKMIQKDIANLDKKFDEMVRHNEELGSKRDDELRGYMKEIREGYTPNKVHEELKTNFEKFKDKMWSINMVLIVAIITGILTIVFKLK